jgi:hypothetical protein
MPAKFRSLLPLLLIAALAHTAGGCSLFKKASTQREAKLHQAPMPPAGPRRIGIIALVNEADRFVLIDTAMAQPPSVGTALKAYAGSVESGVLAVGSIARRPFVVADIVHGSPRKGDAVFQ